jgi:hypothetical protein
MNQDLTTLTLYLRDRPPDGSSEPRAAVEVIPKSDRPELMQLAADAGLNPELEIGATGDTLGHSWEIIVFTVTNAAFWPALATVIRTFITRHRGKKIVLKQGSDSIEITGYSPSEIESIMHIISEPNSMSLDPDNNEDRIGESSD